MDAQGNVTALKSTTPSIEQREAYHILGITCEVVGNDTTPIASCWDRFFKLPAPEAQQGVLAAYWFTSEESFTYMAAYRVPEGTTASGEWQAKSVPAQKYAVWQFEGDPATIPQAYAAIFGELLPASGQTPLKGGTSLEVYPADGWDPLTGIMKADFCIAVE